MRCLDMTRIMLILILKIGINILNGIVKKLKATRGSQEICGVR